MDGSLFVEIRPVVANKAPCFALEMFLELIIKPFYKNFKPLASLDILSEAENDCHSYIVSGIVQAWISTE